jgi:hypothetical protein
MSLQEQGFDGLPVLACLQFGVSPSVLDIGSGIHVSVCSVATGPAAKRLLIGSIGSVCIMAHAALL